MLNSIDSINKIYKLTTWNTLTSLITDDPVIFEHLLDRPYEFRHLFYYKDESPKYQRCPWNCKDNYSIDRNMPIHTVQFTDSFIYKKLADFRNHVFVKLNLDLPKQTNSMIIIERNNSRRFNTKMQALTSEANKNTGWVFKGTYSLETMSFRDQVELFSTTRIFIMRHGSSEINLLWIPQNSIVFEIYGGPNGVRGGANIYKRICKLTDSKHYYLNYDSLDPKNQIINHCKSL